MSGIDKFERLLAAVTSDSSDDPDVVRSDLEGFGVDVAAAKRNFAALLDGLERRAVADVLDQAADRRTTRATRQAEKLRSIREQALPMNVLVRRTTELGGIRAHRDLVNESREDLESYLADLLADDEGRDE